MMMGDTFRPAELTQSTIAFISKLSGPPPTELVTPPTEPFLTNPNALYPLDPARGIQDIPSEVQDPHVQRLPAEVQDPPTQRV